MPKAKKPVREMHRWEKMAAGAADMEALLVECRDFLKARFDSEDIEARSLYGKITTQLFRTGRLE